MDPELSIFKYHPTGGTDIDLIRTIIAALSESQLCGLSDDEEEEIQESNTGRTASKRRREEDEKDVFGLNVDAAKSGIMTSCLRRIWTV